MYGGMSHPVGGLKGSLKLYLIISDVSPIRYNTIEKSQSLWNIALNLAILRIWPDTAMCAPFLGHQPTSPTETSDRKYKAFLPPDLREKPTQPRMAPTTGLAEDSNEQSRKTWNVKARNDLSATGHTLGPLIWYAENDKFLGGRVERNSEEVMLEFLPFRFASQIIWETFDASQYMCSYGFCE